MWFLIFPLLDDDSGVSSFNRFVHELSVDSEPSSMDCSSGEEEDIDGITPASPSSNCSRVSRASSFTKYERHRTGWIISILSWILFPAKFLFGIPFYIGRLSCTRGSKAPSTCHRPFQLHSSIRRVHTTKDHAVHCTTDRRRGVIEVCLVTYVNLSSSTTASGCVRTIITSLTSFFPCTFVLSCRPGPSSSDWDLHRNYIWFFSQGCTFSSFPIWSFENVMEMVFIWQKWHWSYSSRCLWWLSAHRYPWWEWSVCFRKEIHFSSCYEYRCSYMPRCYYRAWVGTMLLLAANSCLFMEFWSWQIHF